MDWSAVTKVRVMQRGILAKPIAELAVGKVFDVLDIKQDSALIDTSIMGVPGYNKQFVKLAHVVSVDHVYPDGNPKSLQAAKKRSLRYSPTAALLHMNAAFEDGAKKYGAANWREKGVAGSVYIDAALRHISLYFDGGEQVANDSKVHHLGHAMACLAIILDAEAAGTLTDDRPTPMPNLEALLKRD